MELLEFPKRKAPAGAIEHELGWHFPDLRDFRLRLVVHSRPFTLKNSKKIIVRPGKPHGKGWRCSKCKHPIIVTLAPSDRAKAYQKTAVEQLQGQWGGVFTGPIPLRVHVNAAIVSYRETRHRNDASNLYQGPEDALEAAGVLEDDFQIATHNDSRRDYDRVDPRVEITLTPAPFSP